MLVPGSCSAKFNLVAIPPDCSGPFLQGYVLVFLGLVPRESQSHLTAQVHSSGAAATYTGPEVFVPSQSHLTAQVHSSKDNENRGPHRTPLQGRNPT